MKIGISGGTSSAADEAITSTQPADRPGDSPFASPGGSASADVPPAASSSPERMPATQTPSDGAVEPTSSFAARALEALREFYNPLTLSAKDRDMLCQKRGFEYRTSDLLGFRSNPRSNKDILIQLAAKHGFEAMIEAGLWQPKDRAHKKERRPNAQFFGLGIIRKRKPGERLASNEFCDEDGNIWGWCEPILIPYFDENGLLIGLRPHKGGGKSGTTTGTPRVYFPRDPKRAAQPETFRTVFITEGEFKAASLWENIGAGSLLAEHEPAGACSLPGISFGKNYEVRQVLEDWLRIVQCRCVIVAFDNEEKGDPALEFFKADWTKRHDATKWMRYLATDLARKLHIQGKVFVLPNDWRNKNGKADWDGAAAGLTNGLIKPTQKSESSKLEEF